jgi:hypothetical protein
MKASPETRRLPTIFERLSARLDLKLPKQPADSWRRRADCGEG